MENSTTEPVYNSDLFIFAKAKVRFDRRIGDWGWVKEKALQNRKDRYADLDVAKMRIDGKIGRKETFIPIRVIDNNIRRELSDAMLFLNGQKRLAYFRCVDDPLVDCRQLESDVTKGLTYKKWYKPFRKHYDGAELHGWSSMEVIYDETKPLRVGFEYISYDRLLFNRDLEDIQDDEFLMVECKASCLELHNWINDYGFDEVQVNILLQETKESAKRDTETFTVYKVYFKEQDQVYICWYSQRGNVSGFLKAPEPLHCGILAKQIVPPQIADPAVALMPGVMPEPTVTFTEAPVTSYPIFLLLSDDDEQTAIAAHKGQAFFAMPNQEAATALLTAYINGMLKASMQQASVDSEDIEASARLEDLEISDDSILPVPIRWHNRNWPDSACLNALQHLSMQNSEGSGKLAVAVSNRKDSRKTAEELQLAQGDQAKITTTNLADYSDFLRELYDFAWLIIQSQAIAGNVPLLRRQITTQTIQGPQVKMENDVETISKKFDVRPAGDIDVIQVQEKLMQMMQDWPVIQAMPGLAQIFMEDFIRLRYPERADQYIAAMKAGDPGKGIIMGLLSIINGSLKPEEIKALSPQEQQQLQMIIQTAQQYVTPETQPGQENASNIK